MRQRFFSRHLLRVNCSDLLQALLYQLSYKPYHFPSPFFQSIMKLFQSYSPQAIYPGRSLFLAFSLKDFPRTSLLYMYVYFYDDMFLPFVRISTRSDSSQPLQASTQVNRTCSQNSCIHIRQNHEGAEIFLSLCYGPYVRKNFIFYGPV